MSMHCIQCGVIEQRCGCEDYAEAVRIADGITMMLPERRHVVALLNKIEAMQSHFRAIWVGLDRLDATAQQLATSLQPE